MSVIVKGMEMPESCSNCELCACYAESRGDVYRCDITMYPVKYFEKRLDNCPLVEVPQHGRLIDATDVLKTITDNSYIIHHGYNETEYGMSCFGIMQALFEAPTIIESERSKKP